MSKRKTRSENRRRACTRKKTFYNQMQAMKVGAKRGLNWYWCPYCYHWHLTSRNTMFANHEKVDHAKA